MVKHVNEVLESSQEKGGLIKLPRLLAPDDDLTDFVSGLASVDKWIREKAQLLHEKSYAKVYVMPTSTGDIAGFYTLSSLSFMRKKGYSRELRKHGTPQNIPATLLGQFAIAKNYQHQGLGKALLRNALENYLKASELIASLCLIVDADGEKARHFWEKFGFKFLEDFNAKPRLYLTHKDIKASFKSEN